MAKEKKIKEINDLPGVGPSTVEKLKEAGFFDLMSVAASSLSKIVEVAGLSEAVSRKIINTARDSLKMGFKSGIAAEKDKEKVIKISTGSPKFDELVGGGFETGTITECYGEFGCLTGDTLIRISRGEKGHQQRIDWMFKQLHENKDMYPRWNLSKKTYVRSFDGNNKIGRHPILDVVYSGKKQVFELELENGFKLKATPKHKIMTSEGWREMHDLNDHNLVMCDTPHTKKNKQGLKANNSRDFCLYHAKYHPCKGKTKRLEIHRAIFEANMNNISLAEFVKIINTDEEKAASLKYIDTDKYVIHHKDGNHYNNDIKNLELMAKEKHLKLHGTDLFKNFNQGVPEFVKVKYIKKGRVEKTYDIICEEPLHNFNANDIIVHNSGKTQIGHLISVNLLKQDPKAVVVYIDTENTFKPGRIRQFAKGAGLDEEDILKRILVAKALSSDHQMLLAENVEKLISKEGKNIKLIVVDSLTAHLRVEYLGRGTLSERQQTLNRHMHVLLKIADSHNVCVYVTNQVMANPSMMFGDPTTPIGGHIVGHNSATRIYLRKGKKGSRVAKLVDSPDLPDGEVVFEVTETGLKDI